MNAVGKNLTEMDLDRGGISRMAVTKLVRRGAEIESDLGACLDAG